MLQVDGHIPDPGVDSNERGEDRGKPDWTFADHLLPVVGENTGGTIDLRPFATQPPNQRDTNSCVAQAVTSALELCRLRDGKPSVELSTLQLWFATRQRMNPPRSNVNSGTWIWLACNTIRKLGVVPERKWPFLAKMYHVNPGPLVMHAAAGNKIEAYYRIDAGGEERVRQCVLALLAGHPVAFGTVVGSDWFRARGDDVIGFESNPTGRHAMVLVGWTGDHFVVMNSWGIGWADGGFALVEPDVIADSDTSDLWVITRGLE
jgi:hypothetical protein